MKLKWKATNDLRSLYNRLKCHLWKDEVQENYFIIIYENNFKMINQFLTVLLRKINKSKQSTEKKEIL